MGFPACRIFLLLASTGFIIKVIIADHVTRSSTMYNAGSVLGLSNSGSEAEGQAVRSPSECVDACLQLQNVCTCKGVAFRLTANNVYQCLFERDPALLPPVTWIIYTLDNEPGWTIFHRRFNGLLDFYLPWSDYRDGFGHLQGEFWLGLEQLHQLTNSQQHRMKVEIEDWDCNSFHSVYEKFHVGPELDGYRLNISEYNPALSTAGDSLINPPWASARHDGMKFSTYDNDNDLSGGNCAVNEHSAWWYNRCGASTPNGRYVTDGQTSTQGILWYAVYNNWYSFKRFEMKIQPV